VPLSVLHAKDGSASHGEAQAKARLDEGVVLQLEEVRFGAGVDADVPPPAKLVAHAEASHSEP
jgi:hypothetical protein